MDGHLLFKSNRKPEYVGLNKVSFGSYYPMGIYRLFLSTMSWYRVMTDTFENKRWVVVSEKNVPAEIRTMALLMRG